MTSAASNPEINYQGKLTNNAGTAVANGTYNMRFWLLTSQGVATTSAVWTESLTGTNKVQVTNGLFSIMLGSTSALTGVNFNQTLYLGVEIGGTGSPSWDGEMSPRKIIGSVPTAFDTRKLGGVASTSFTRSDEADTIAATTASTLLTVNQTGTGHILDLLNGATTTFAVTKNGLVGIGTSTPSYKLTIQGNGGTYNSGDNLLQIKASTANGGGGFTVNKFGNAYFNGVFLGYDANVSNSALSSTGGDLYITTNAEAGTNSNIIIKPNGTGKVGIGTTTPSQELTIAGDIRLTGRIYDSANSAGTNGMILKSTGTGQTWVATSTLGFGTSNFTAADIDTCSEIAAIVGGETGTCGSLVLSVDPTFTGTVNAAALTLSSTLTMSGSAANIALGSNWLSGDGGDEGVFVSSTGNVGIGTTTPSSKLDVWGNFRVGTSSNSTLLVDTNSNRVIVGTNYDPFGLFNVIANPEDLNASIIRTNNAQQPLTDFTFQMIDSGGNTGNTISSNASVRGIYNLLDYTDNTVAGAATLTVIGTENSLTMTGNNSTGQQLFYGNLVNVSGGTDGTTAGYGYYANVYGADTNYAFYGAAGQSYFKDNVGIGTTTPSRKLTVAGSAWFGGNLTATGTLSVSGATTLSSTLNVTGKTTLANATTTNLAITGKLYDSGSSVGTNGYVLKSTGTSTRWVATSTLGLSSGGLASTDIDTCSELAAIMGGETGTCGSLVLSVDPTFTGTVNAAALTLSSTLTMSGSAANIALGSNWLSGDGQDEGVFVSSIGRVGIGTSSPASKLDVWGNFRVGTSSTPVVTIDPNGQNALYINSSVQSGTGLWIENNNNFYGVYNNVFNPINDFAANVNSIGGLTNVGGISNYTLISNSVSDTDPSPQIGTTNITGLYNDILLDYLGASAVFNVTGEHQVLSMAYSADPTSSQLFYGNNVSISGLTTGSTTAYGYYANVADADRNYAFYGAAGQSYFKDNVGIGTTTPGARLQILGTTQQLRTGYDASNYLTVTTGSTGTTTFAAVGTSPVVQFTDNQFELADNTDPTKRMGFQLSGISAGTKSTWTFPAGTATFVGTNLTQTLTNKTLTSPTFGGNATATNLYLTGRFYDTNASAGTKGMVLLTTATSTRWVATSTLGLATSGSGLTSLNGLTASTQTFASSSSGTDFNITSSGSVHTFRMPSASSVNRGLLTAANWTSFNAKVASSSIDTSAELLALVTDETGTGRLVYSGSPAFSGTATFSALTATSTLTLSGTAANIALGSNYLSGDGGDEGVFVSSTGLVGIGTSSPVYKLDITGTAGNNNLFAVSSSSNSRLMTLSGIRNGARLEVVGDIVSAGTKWATSSEAEANGWQSIAYGNNLFVAVSSNGTNQVMTSPDGITWTARAEAEANAWRDITYGNGLFVAVADTGTNRVMTSPDGITWTARAASEANSWGAVTYGNGLFVAISSDGSNQVMTSPDGITWTARAEAEANAWIEVTYGNGLFVAVSANGTNRVMTSSNGTSWSTASAAAATTWSEVEYGNGLFVALANNAIMTSPNGTTWTSRTSPLANNWGDVAYGNGLFVAVSSNGTSQVMTSPDGITWTTRTEAETTSWSNIAYGNGRFVAVATAGTNQVMTSGQPEASLLAHNNIYQGGMSIMSGNVGIGTSTPTSKLAIIGQGGSTQNIFSVASSSNTKYFNVTSAGLVGIGTSTPAKTLSVAGTLRLTGALFDSNNSAGTNGMVLQSTATGQRWVATSTLGLATSGSGLTSLNGLTASTQTFASSSSGTDFNITSSGSVHTFRMPSASSVNRGLLTAANWTTFNAKVASSSIDTSAELLALVTDETGTGRLVFAGSPAFTGTATFAGLTASSSLTLSGTAANIILGSNYLSGDGGDEGVFVSSAGLVGIGTSSPVYKLDITGTAGNNNLFAVSSSSNSRLMTLSGIRNGARLEVVGDIVSAGTKWATSSETEASLWRSVAYGNGIFVAVSETGTNQVMTSPDGVVWTARAEAEANSWYDITYGNGLFVAVAYTGTNRVMTSPDGITWTARRSAEQNQWFSITYGNGLFVAVSNDGTNQVMTSPDGITWTARAEAEANDWRGITYGNSLFVAVSQDGTNQVMTSPDGITWTARAESSANQWNGVTYGNGLFVAVSKNGTDHVMTSPDGTTWTTRTAPEVSLWRDITYGNGLFVAVASPSTGSSLVMTSPDGITWTLRSATEANTWWGVAYGNGRFVAISSSGTNQIMHSGQPYERSYSHNNTYQGGMSIMSGNVGIGTSTPTSKLAIIGQGGSTQNIFSVASSSNTKYFNVTSAGLVGVGTSTPAKTLSVAGTLRLTGALFDSNNSAGTNGMILKSTGTGQTWVATSTLGFLANTGIDTCSEFAAIMGGETGTCGSVVLSVDPTFTGTVNAAALTLSSTLTLSGSAANIALGSNYLSGDGGDEGVYVTSTGNVGIGTTTPVTKLQVYGTGDLFRIGDNTTASAYLSFQGGRGDVGYINDFTTLHGGVNKGIKFTVNNSAFGSGTTALTIIGDASGPITVGNIGIGTTTPNQALTIFRSGADAAIEFSTVSGANEKWTIGVDDSDGTKFKISSSSALGTNDRLVINGKGYVGIGTSSPLANLHIHQVSPTANQILFQLSTSDDASRFSIDEDGDVTADGEFSGTKLSAAASGLTSYVATSSTVHYPGYTGTTNATLHLANFSVSDSAYFPTVMSVRNSSSIAQYSYIATVAASGGSNYSPSLVFGQQTGANSYAERMRIGTSGNIGIGTTTPSQMLTVGATTGSQLLVTSLGAITDGSWTADTIADDYGGTGQSTYSTGDMLYASGANTLAKRTIGSTGNVLSVVGGVPTWVATSTLGLGGAGASTFLALTDTIDSFNTGRVLFSSASGVIDDTDFKFATNTNTLTVGGLTLSNSLFAFTAAATTTVVNNNPFAWTIATSSTANPFFRIDTTVGSEQVVVGLPGGDVYIGGVGSPSDLVFEEDATIRGQGTNLLTFGQSGDRINFAVNVGIGSSTPRSKLAVVGTGGSTQDIFSVSSSTNTKFLTVKSTGMIGIGTSTPNQMLSIFKNGADAAIEFSSASGANSKWTLGLDYSDGGKFKISSSSALGTSDRFVIDGKGRVGIGTSSANANLTIQSTVSGWVGMNGYSNNLSNGFYLDLYSASTTLNTNGKAGGFTLNDLSHYQGAGLFFKTYNSNFPIKFQTTPAGGSITTRMTISADGDIGIGTTTPSKRLTVFETVADSQVAIAYDATRFANMQVDSTGDLLLSSTGKDTFWLDSNVWACSNGACPSVTASSTGNMVLENGLYFGNGYRIDRVPATTTQIGIFNITNASVTPIIIFE